LYDIFKTFSLINEYLREGFFFQKGIIYAIIRDFLLIFLISSQI